MQLTWPGSWGVTTPLPTYQISASYNDADQPTTVTTSTNPAGQGYTTTNVYDSTSGALIGLSNTSSANANVATLTFTPRAQINTVTYLTTASTGLSSEQFGYDANLRPTSASATWLSGSGSSGTILSQNRTYDPASNVTNLSTTLAAVPGASGSGGSETQNFCYDEQNRLVWAGNSGSQPLPGNGTCGMGTLANTLQNAGYGTSYVYTHLGQLWQGPQSGSSTPSQYLYCDSNHPHQLTGLYTLGSTCSTKLGQTYTSSYDAWGNVTGRTVTSTSATLSYDGLDHLTSWNADSTGQEQYLYDASGERVLRRSTSAGTTAMTVYAFGLEEHLYSGSGVHQGDTYYYSLGGLLIGEFDGTNTNMFLTDALGSVIETISAAPNSASVQGNQVYGPYGTSRYQQGSMATTKGFTGQYSDSLTGLDYYGSRYYDPVVGRFLSADALGGLDPYAYVDDNPETYSDPTGHIPCASDGVGPCSGSPSPGGGPASKGGNGVTQSSVLPPPPVQVVPSNPLTWPIIRVLVPTIEAEVEGAAIGMGVAAAVVVGVVFLLAISVAIMMAPPRSNGSQYPPNTPQPVPAPTPTTTKAPTTTTASATGAITLSLQPHDNPPATQTGGNGRLPPIKPPVAAAGGTCSFTSDTAVTTKSGKQDIGKLHVSDKVLAYNPKTHKMELEPILHVWINHDSDLVDLTITTTTQGQHGKATKPSEVIHTNQKHPFLTLEQGFLPVGKIKLGMHVLRADGSVGVITGWKVVPGTKMMYNLEVAQDHTFMVGAGQWVVHNRCGGPNDLTNPTARNAARRVTNAFNDHLTPSDLEGAWRDIQGNPVPNPAGGFFDHLGEVQDALQSGKNAIEVFRNLLDDPSLSATDRCIVQCFLSRTSKTIDYVEKVISRDTWFPGTSIPPFP